MMHEQQHRGKLPGDPVDSPLPPDGADRPQPLGDLVRDMTHEVNQPLAAITNYVAACLRQLDGAEPDLASVCADLQEIGEETLRTAEVVRRMRESLLARTDETPEGTAP